MKLPSRTSYSSGTTVWTGQEWCECLIHRYHIAHICECGKLYSHSQRACDEHRGHRCINFPSGDYLHGWTVSEMYDYLAVRGMLPYGTDTHEVVYDKMAELQEASR